MEAYIADMSSTGRAVTYSSYSHRLSTEITPESLPVDDHESATLLDSKTSARLSGASRDKVGQIDCGTPQDESESLEDPPLRKRKACVLLFSGLLVAVIMGLWARAWHGPQRGDRHRQRLHEAVSRPSIILKSRRSRAVSDDAAASDRDADTLAASAAPVGATAAAPVVHATTTPPAPAPVPQKGWSVELPVQARVDLCDATAAVPVSLPPHAFHMSSVWRKRCQARPNRASEASWSGRNWCWASVKGQCLYDSKGHATWQQSQEIVARQGLAPPVGEVLFTPITSRQACERLTWATPDEITPTVSEISEATLWLNSHVYVMVLNLPTAIQRWRVISRHLDSLGIKYRRSPAVDMSAKGAYEDAKKSGDMPDAFDFEAAQKIAQSQYQGKGGIVGTVGVATAHLRTIRRAIAGAKNHSKSMVLVIEDDAELATDFAARLMRLVQTEIPCDWHALSLKSRCAYGQCVTPHLARVWPDGNEPADRCRQGVNIGFYAMLYRAEALPYIQERMRRRVWDASTPHCLDVDVALASISDQVAYYAVPSFLQPAMLREGHMGSSRFAINEADTHVA